MSSTLMDVLNPTKTSKPRVAVIDDAFDDVEAGEISVEEYLNFHQLAQEDGIFEEILAKLDIAEPEVYAGDEPPVEYLPFLQKLWVLRRTNSRVADFVDVHLFADKAAKLKTLETICQNLEASNLDVSKINSHPTNFELFAKGEFIYVFIDYNLGIQIGPEAKQNAKDRALEIYQHCPEGRKPVTILMSSETGIEQLISRFQEEAGLLEGVFRFSPKEQLSDEHKFSLLIRAYKQEFVSSHALQGYIRTLTRAAESALGEFLKEVRTLRIEDYAYLQNSALSTDAQPLGDYLAWLYGTHWANLLLRNEELREQQSAIDRVFAKDPPLHHRPPSPKLSDIYMSALFESGLRPIQQHPLEGMVEGEPTELPYLHLGDLLTKSDDATVWLVLNAQCDLERPKKKNADRSIFLLRGTLVRFDSEPAKDHKTDFFFFDETPYRIEWQVKQVKTIALGKFTTWQQTQGLERHFRLRLPFALELQQAFAASLTRVGMPVSPPLTQEIALEVLLRNKKNNSGSVFLPRQKQYAFRIVTRSDGNKKARLTLNFAMDFMEALLTEQKTLTNTLLTAGRAEADSSRKILEGIQKLLAEFNDWFFTKTEFLYPSASKPFLVLQPNLVGLTIDADLKALPNQQSQTLFVLNIVTNESVPATPADELTNPPVADEN